MSSITSKVTMTQDPLWSEEASMWWPAWSKNLAHSLRIKIVQEEVWNHWWSHQWLRFKKELRKATGKASRKKLPEVMSKPGWKHLPAFSVHNVSGSLEIKRQTHISLIASRRAKDCLIWIHHQSKRDMTTHYITKNNHQEVRRPKDFLDHIIIICRRNQVQFHTKTFHQKRTQTLETLALSQMTSIKSSNELREWLKSKQRTASD